MQALHSERRYFRRIALRESIDVTVMDNSNVNGVAKMIQPPRNRRLPTDVRSADRASVIHPVLPLYYDGPGYQVGAFFAPDSRTGTPRRADLVAEIVGAPA